jgi:hypothetical protein
VGGTSLLDTILLSLFENSEFLLGRELLSGFDPTDRFAPIAVALITDLVFGTDVFNTGLLALFKYCELLLLAKRDPCFDPRNHHCRL